MTPAQGTAFRLVDDQLDLYRKHAESWKDAHDAAMACFEFEELLALGLAAFDSINRADEWLRSQVASGKAEYDADEDAKVGSLYRLWLSASRFLVDILPQLEQRFEVRGAEEFRRCYREAQGILTPDNEFFAHDALAVLRDEAIDAYRRGETVEMKELSD